MVVTVEREAQPRDEVAAAVTVLRRADFDKLPAESLAEALASVPGISMMFEGGGSGAPIITSRGFFGGGEVEYVKLLVDGVPVGDAESDLADWSRFRLGAIERIEIVHGPGSAAWGDTALGGVIQLFTRRDAAAKGWDLRLNAGSFGARDAELGYDGDLGRGLRLGVRGSAAATDGYRDHAGRDDADLQLTLDRLRDSSRWQVTLSSARKNRDEPGPLTVAEIAGDRTQSNPLFRLDREETTRERIAAAYDTATAHVVAYGGWRTSDNMRTILLAPGFGATARRELRTNDYGLTSDVTGQLLRGTVHAGADVRRASLEGTYSSTDGRRLASEDGSRDAVGLFATASWSVCARCRLTAGVRRDEIRDDFAAAGSGRSSATSPRVALAVRTGAATSLFVQLSRAFKAPTLDQLFDPRPFPNGFGGTFTISNSELRPQRARNAEAGASGGMHRAKWSLVAYRMNVTDEIDFDPQTFAYRNIGSSIHRGAEGSLTMPWARLTPTLTYAWTRVEDAANRGRQLKNIPEHVAQALLHADLPRGVTADVVYRWMSGRWLDDDGQFREPDVGRADIRLARAFGAVRITADLLNATGARYNELGFVLADFRGRPTPLQFPAPGRSVRLGVTWSGRR